MFKKNLEFINNEGLKSRLESLTIEESRIDMSYCMTPSNDYLLLKNDVPMDDINNPREAAKEMLKSAIKQPMGTNDIIIVFGIGMCYLLDETYNTYPSKIYLYEPDTKVLHFVLSNVDISEHLSSGRVYITDKLDDIISKLSDEYVTKDKVEVVYLKNYAIVKSQELLELTQKVYETCKSRMIDINTITRYSKEWTVNLIKNIKTINEKDIYAVSDLENKFEGQTALLIAAGPSLKENIENIKQNRDKYVIFVVNKVLRDVLNNNIIPDFVVCMDAQNIEKTFAGLDEYFPKINCICDVKSSESLFNKNFKKFFVSFAANDIIVKELKEYNPSIVTYECGGSAATMSLVLAHQWGFSKIVFAGRDLAFKNDVAYSSGEVINRISDDTINAEFAEKKLSKVKSVTGDYVLTRDDYAGYVKHFETIIKEYGINEVYNTTSFGAEIKGMKNVLFENINFFTVSNTTAFILGSITPIKLNTQEWIQKELFLINNVISLLSKEAFSPALVSSIVKTPVLYQYMQADILNVLQSRMDESLAVEFLDKTKSAIKEVIDLLQRNRLI